MQVGLLGPLVVWHDGVEHRVPRASARTILAMLALSPGMPVSADRLGDALWPVDAPATWRNVLQVQVGHLRRACPWLPIETQPVGYTLQLASADVDAGRFTRLVEESTRLLPGSDPVQLHATGVDVERMRTANVALGEALALWRGPALAEFTYAPFAQPHVARLDALRLTALERRLGTDIALGRHQLVVTELEALTAEHPLREMFWAQLAVALYRTGRQADALAALANARVVLREELGLDPGPHLRRLEEQVLQQDPVLDVAEPRADRLPRLPGKLIGRQGDVQRLVANLRDPDVGLVSIVGPGGVGKTRLAVEVARILAEERATSFVALADVGDPAEVPAVVAQTQGITSRAADALEALRRASTTGAPALWVLDNCEHVLDGVAATLAAVSGPGSRIVVLATSREPIGVRSERRYVLEPLRLPDPGASVPDVLAAPAVALLMERAAAADVSSHVTEATARDLAELVQRLDGLPLAIELAAPALAVLTPPEVAERFARDGALPVAPPRDVELRHRSLTDALHWSWVLLREPERHLLARLSIFVGGFDLAAVAAVCADGAKDVEETLTSLVTKNLVTITTSDERQRRFTLLRTVRDYVAGHLTGAEHESVAAAHRRHYRSVLGPLPLPGHLPRIDPEFMQTYVRDHDNLRAARASARDGGELVEFAEFCSLLWMPSLLTGRSIEAARELERVLDADAAPPGEDSVGAESPYPPTLRVDLRLALGTLFTQGLGDLERGFRLYLEAVDLAEHQPDDSLKLGAYVCAVMSVKGFGEEPPETTHLLQRTNELAAQEHDRAMLALYHCALGLYYSAERHDDAERMFLLSLQDAYALDDTLLTHMALLNLGEAAAAQGRYELVQAWSERAVHVGASLGAEALEVSQANLATGWLGAGNAARAAELLVVLVEQAWINGNVRLVAELLQRLAAAAAAQGEHVRALTLYGCYRIALDVHQWAATPADELLTSRFLSDLLARPDAAVAISTGQGMDLRDAVAFAVAGSPSRGVGRP